MKGLTELLDNLEGKTTPLNVISEKSAELTKEDNYKFKPSDYSDVGQAQLTALIHGDIIRYNVATGYMTYINGVWAENHIAVQGIQQAVTDRQLAESQEAVYSAYRAMAAADTGENYSDSKKVAANELKKAKAYRDFVLRSRQAGKINSVLTCMEPYVYIDGKELDKDPFLLNTPGGTVNLKTGELMPHNPADYCTKITAVSPNAVNMNLWLDTVNTFCCGDNALIEYQQQISGMFAISKVLNENLIIAVGTGKNGKSTFFNTISQVLGSYSGACLLKFLQQAIRAIRSPNMRNFEGNGL
jgi:phage/plasmid-associated DNA primase